MRFGILTGYALRGQTASLATNVEHQLECIRSESPQARKTAAVPRSQRRRGQHRGIGGEDRPRLLVFPLDSSPTSFRMPGVLKL